MAPGRIGSKRKTLGPNESLPKKTRKTVAQGINLEPDNKRPCRLAIMGDGETGQLGLGPEIIEKARPAIVPDLNDVIEVAVGGMHTVVLTKTNEVITFGCNDEGALGRDTSVEESETTPGTVYLPGKVVQISAGDSHSAALTDNGALYAWGTFRDTHGSMGLFEKRIERVPVLVQIGGVKFTKVSSGTHHLILLGSNGKVYSAGCGDQGQLGRVSVRKANRDARNGLNLLLTPNLVYMPFINGKTNTVKNVWTGSHNTFVQTDKGKIYVFGLNNYCQLGINNSSQSSIIYHPTLSASFSGKNWVKVSGGEHHTLALDDSGSVYVLGRKEYGRLGLGENCADALEPTVVKIGNDKKCVDVSCGSFTSFAVTRDGKLFSWGMGSNMLGQGDSSDIFAPREVKGKQIEGKKVWRVAGGGQHAAMLVQD